MSERRTTLASADRRERERPSRDAYATRRVGFDVDGDRCVGRLYLPANADDPPAVVMAHGYAAEASFGFDRYAEAFAAAGYAAFVFDYRGFGPSEGDPLALPSRQLADWRAALDRIDRVSGVGAGRVLWGTALSGGYALALAAERTDVDVVLAQMPLANGRSLLATHGVVGKLHALVSGVRDRVGGALGRPHTVKAFGSEDEFAALNTPGAKDGLLSLVPRESSWRNETRARTFLALPRFSPVDDAASVTCPVFLVAGTNDDVIPYHTVETLADKLPDASLLRVPMGHFDAYTVRFDELVAQQIAFLDARL